MEPRRHKEHEEVSWTGEVVVPSEEVESLAAVVVDSALEVHRELGPGLLESAYQLCLDHVLRRRGVLVRREVSIPVVFQGVRLDASYRIDMIVGDSILVENKAVHQITPVHLAQLITYLKLSGLHLGFLINWNVPRIRDGLRRVIQD
jgi:GxxExxY protein